MSVSSEAVKDDSPLSSCDELTSDEEPQILLIRKEDLISPQIVALIYDDMFRDYYLSNDWSPQMYTFQAIRGFIAVGYKETIDVERDHSLEFLLPQIQKSYCVLDWDIMNSICRRSLFKQIRKKVSSFSIRINHNFDLTLSKILDYHGEKGWLCPSYISVCKTLFRMGTLHIPYYNLIDNEFVEKYTTTFRMCSIELYSPDCQLVAGEIGYATGSVFTSLTGFCKREKGRSVGKIQIISLALLLQRYGFKYLNLGHPPSQSCPSMQYKAEIGGREISRKSFLQKWYDALQNQVANHNDFFNASVPINELL